MTPQLYYVQNVNHNCSKTTLNHYPYYINLLDFNNNYPIEYSDNYLLRNGSHRLSYCYHAQKTFICIKINPRATTGPYSIDWFKQEGFSEKELNIIKNELNKLILFISS